MESVLQLLAALEEASGGNNGQTVHRDDTFQAFFYAERLTFSSDKRFLLDNATAIEVATSGRCVSFQWPEIPWTGRAAARRRNQRNPALFLAPASVAISKKEAAAAVCQHSDDCQLLESAVNRFHSYFSRRRRGYLWPAATSHAAAVPRTAAAARARAESGTPDETPMMCVRGKRNAKRSMTSADELKQQNTNCRKKERELAAALRRHVEAAEVNQSSWKARLAKRELKIEALRRQCQDRQEELERVERERIRESEEREQDKIDLTEQQLDKQKNLVALREKVAKLTAAAEKAQAKEQLFRREIFRLRKELLLSESQRETEHRRQAQLIEGKEKEVAFIWQKYVEVMPLAEGNSSF
ncbi:hypothetical protein ON010_g7847 [Phytophthora cinnamomi]|nr:hypothetical protein ON010_g7847 [Phytophthora cinnamomi]